MNFTFWVFFGMEQILSLVMSQYKSKFQNTEVFYICVCICVGIGKVILFQLLSLKKWETDTCTCNMMQYLKKKQFCNKCLPVPWFVSAK